MRAVRLHGVKDLRVEEIDAPKAPGPHEVTLSVAMAGICGSDLHNFKTGAWISRAPSVAGHEFTGIVTALGAQVSHVAPGDRVIVDSRHTCGTCPACLSGRAQVCAKLGFLGEVIDGGFAESVTIPARNVLRAAEVPDRHLALAEPLAVALHALNRLQPQGDVVIAGCGPIGGLIALLASTMGHHPRVMDINAARAALVAEATGGEVVQAPGGFLHAVDTTGHPAVIAGLLDRIEGCGRLALVGIGQAAQVIDPVKLVEREITLLGCHAFGDELAEVNRLLPILSPRLDAFIAEEIPLQDVPAAYARHLGGAVKGLKTLIRCDQPPLVPRDVSGEVRGAKMG